MAIVPDLQPTKEAPNPTTSQKEQTVAPTQVASAVWTLFRSASAAPLKVPLSLFVFRDKQQSRDFGIRLWCTDRHESLSKCKGLSSLTSTSKENTSFTHNYKLT